MNGLKLEHLLLEPLEQRLVTTEPAPIVQPSPMVTPGQITVLPPIQQSSPMVTGLDTSKVRRSTMSKGCEAV